VKPAYPEGEFRINETKVIYVKKGTSYLSIAEKFAMPLTRLFEFNDMNQQETADKDQLIYTMRKRKTGLNDQHIVKPGETLHDIAQSEAMRLESLLEYNLLQPDMKPAVGSVLYLRTKAPATPTMATGK
jgi:LysM repeat protein